LNCGARAKKPALYSQNERREYVTTLYSHMLANMPSALNNVL